MKGNVFGKWLQEFCSLVFVQTIQAFVLAMIMTLVVTAMTAGTGSSQNTEVLYSTGMLAIIALASISKIELLVKKIFGLEGGLGDKAGMHNGKGGLLGTIMALQMGKKALDNIPKIAGGAYGAAKTSNTIKREKMLNADKLRKLDSRYGMGSADAGNGAGAIGQDLGAGTESGAGISGSGTSGISGSGSATKSASSGGAGNMSKIAYEEKREKILEDYNAKILDLKKQRGNQIKEAVSGGAETVGGILGGSAAGIGKAIISGASGEIDAKGVLNSVGIGIGVGDKIAQKTVDTVKSTNDLSKEVSRMRDVSKSYKNRQDEIEKLLKDTKKRIDAGNMD